MTVKSPCKGCSESVKVTEESIQQSLSDIQIKKSQTVSEHVYQERLSKCNTCSSLQYGTTCMHCGCLVRYRAKFKNKSCPYPGEAKW
ncbi:DUF6171 family protein [Thalassobacillus pellis]|uniref:DUF6171 family protein n=1 Tax=Thalassobacillus pellis TaxID=748008 RepID=UPI001EF9A92C|nr:DUF6171 family protein [Thalassobacillus pellis]MBM7553149.1 hypothetical protein [Thalassobacillus pellis]